MSNELFEASQGAIDICAFFHKVKDNLACFFLMYEFNGGANEGRCVANQYLISLQKIFASNFKFLVILGCQTCMEEKFGSFAFVDFFSF